ncbi:unnamed protein product [Hymenolepis diminuta]|uniref:Uncharacterized protein n=1 Tax=Hymenolepis diminuta TaxID=6216 RepID=A0A564Z8C3_HYMDI|nr:unnamed protein product [Hymenolepis diminuta]
MRPAAYFIFVLVFVTFFKNSYPYYKERAAKRNRDKEDEFDSLNNDWDEWDDDSENKHIKQKKSKAENSINTKMKRKIRNF